MDINIFFQVTRGAPLTVLLALCSTGGQASLQELCKITGYTHKTVQTALDKLMGFEMVTRTHYHDGWLLTSGGTQPPLFFADKINKGKIFPTTTVNLIESINNNKLLNTEAVDGKISLILQEAGIGEPMRSRLASDPEITAEYAQAILEDGKREGQALGLIIHRLKTHEPIMARSHKRDCNCHECYLKRHTGGEYSEYINR